MDEDDISGELAGRLAQNDLLREIRNLLDKLLMEFKEHRQWVEKSN